MKIIRQSVEILTPLDEKEILKHIEKCGRVCYKSEGKITDDSAKPFVKKIIDRGHESVLEHFSITVKFIVDRGISHELVRHRIASFSQESTRYCNYLNEKFGEEIIVIKPFFFEEDSQLYRTWKHACKDAERAYFDLIDRCATPQEARSVLPNSLKTEIVVTTNLREWRHILKLRTDHAAHPQMREIMNMLLVRFKVKLPTFFEDISIQ